MCCIQNPKIPPQFSESLLKVCGPKLIPGSSNWVLGGGTDANFPRGVASAAKVETAELKSTNKDFSSFSERDVKLDNLIWFDLSCLHAVNPLSAEAKVYVLSDPAAHGLRPGRIVIKQFLATVGQYVREYRATMSQMAAGEVKEIKRNKSKRQVSWARRARGRPKARSGPSGSPARARSYESTAQRAFGLLSQVRATLALRARATMVSCKKVFSTII